MKLFISICCFMFIVSPPELSKVRADYIIASGNQEIRNALHKSLEEINKADDKVLVAYKGAVQTMMAKSAKGSGRKVLFKEGALLIEFAVASEQHNIEIRAIRLSIQENIPKFLKYNSNVSEDKQFILKNYKTTASEAVKEFVRSYVLQSDGFTKAEKELFD